MDKLSSVVSYLNPFGKNAECKTINPAQKLATLIYQVLAKLPDLKLQLKARKITQEQYEAKKKNGYAMAEHLFRSAAKHLKTMGEVKILLSIENKDPERITKYFVPSKDTLTLLFERAIQYLVAPNELMELVEIASRSPCPEMAEKISDSWQEVLKEQEAGAQVLNTELKEQKEPDTVLQASQVDGPPPIPSAPPLTVKLH